MKKILIVLLLAFVITVSGCVGGGPADVTSVVKTVPQVQEFLREYPNAEITAVLWSSSYIQSNMDKIKENCIPAIEDKSYYKVDIQENELKMTAWVSSDDYTVVCIYKEGGEILTTTTTQETTTIPTELGCYGFEYFDYVEQEFTDSTLLENVYNGSFCLRIKNSDEKIRIETIKPIYPSVSYLNYFTTSHILQPYEEYSLCAMINLPPEGSKYSFDNVEIYYQKGEDVDFNIDKPVLTDTATCNGIVYIDKITTTTIEEEIVDCSLAAIELIDDRVYVNTEDKTFNLELSNTGGADLTGLKVIFFNDTYAGTCIPSPQTHIESGEIEVLSCNFCEEMPSGGINKVRVTTATCAGVKPETTNIIEESNVQCQYANLQVETAVYDDSEDKIVAIIWNMGKQELSNFEFLVYYSEENMVTLTPEDADIVLSEEEFHTFTVEDVISTPVKIQVRSNDCPRESMFTCIYSSGKFNC